MMPAHWGDAKYNIVTQSSPTGSQMLGAVGCAEASRYIVNHPGLPGCVANSDELTYVSLGEGACFEGEVWEGLNTACTLKLPLLIVVADNGWAISVPVEKQTAGGNIARLVSGFLNLKIFECDVSDFLEQLHRSGAVVASLDAEPFALYRTIERFIRRRQDEGRPAVPPRPRQSGDEDPEPEGHQVHDAQLVVGRRPRDELAGQAEETSGHEQDRGLSGGGLCVTGSCHRSNPPASSR